MINKYFLTDSKPHRFESKENTELPVVQRNLEYNSNSNYVFPFTNIHNLLIRQKYLSENQIRKRLPVPDVDVYKIQELSINEDA